MTQEKALELMNQGYNIFLTGPPGSGKSYVVDKFVKIARSKGKQVAITATTGIAASLLSGVTIHSWSGIGTGKDLSDNYINQALKRPILVDRLKDADILIIDEISMIDGVVLDFIGQLLVKLRSDNQAFGGLQVIFSGDFFQLPPVSQESGSYAFNSRSWRELDLKICYLSEQYRQIDDPLSEVLSALRDRRFERKHLDILTARRGLNHPECTMLLSHNTQVDYINNSRLARINAKQHDYQMTFSGKEEESAKLSRSVLAPSLLSLKIGASVMFVANDFLQGFANGTQGKVVSFKSDMPVVELEGSGKKIKVDAHSWKAVVDDKVIAEITQLPLRLAWAITIHKSQGMSLDEADIDLNRSFTYGMGYVALSRLRTYEGLYLSGFNSRSLQLDPKIYELDLELRSKSESISG